MTKGEKTRQEIVEQAAALFNQNGFSGFSMSELLKATGLEFAASVDRLRSITLSRSFFKVCLSYLFFP